MRRSFKYRLFINANQERELNIALETHRRLYNVYLDYRELAYQQCGVTLTYFDCSRWFKIQRRTSSFFARINFSSAQATMRRLDKTFAAFFRRECSACGAEVRKELKVRRHDCPHCGLSLHRDENAARNILARGLPARTGPVGANARVA